MNSLIRLLEIPGVRGLNEALSIPGRQLLPEWDDLEDRIDAMSLKLFGITESDTNFSPKPAEILHGDMDTLTSEGALRWQRWEAHFEFLEWEWDEEGAFWAAVDLDVRDDDGDRSLIMDYWGRQLVCVIKGLLPQARLHLDLSGDTSEHEQLRRWEAMMNAEAERFRKSRA